MPLSLPLLQGNPGRDGDGGPQGIQGPEVGSEKFSGISLRDISFSCGFPMSLFRQNNTFHNFFERVNADHRVFPAFRE